MKTAAATLALIMLISQFVAAMGSAWCPDGCCTSDGRSGFCVETERDISSKQTVHDCDDCTDCEQDTDDCCLDLPDDEQRARPFADGFDCDLVPLATNKRLLSLVGAPPVCQQRFLIPQAIGPPWHCIKKSIEILI